MSSKNNILKKQYQIITYCPKAIEWDDYENMIIKEYEELMKNKANDESAFQNFFEKNPCMLPGAFGFFGESGHTPFNNVLITQPKLTGLTTKIPDFLWIANDSCTIYPIFIEIEKPSKKWFVSDGKPSSEFTHAQNQLTDWKVWFSNSTHQNLFFQYYNVDTEFMRGKSIEPYYVLIYGCRDEFIDKPELNIKRSQLQRKNEIYMTFNRVMPNIKGRNIITCTVKEQKYYAKYVQPVFRVGPVFAEEISMIHDKVDAISNNTLISDERKEFLLSRLPYWDEYGHSKRCGLVYTGDWE